MSEKVGRGRPGVGQTGSFSSSESSSGIVGGLSLPQAVVWDEWIKTSSSYEAN